MILRASSAPLYSVCRGGAYPEPGEVVINRTDQYGTFGTAVHAAGAQIVQGKEEVDTGAIANSHNLDEAQRRRFCYMVGLIFRWWTEHGEWFCKDDGTIRVLDFKTTRLKDVHYEPQLMEYLYLAPLCVRSTGPMVEAEMSYSVDPDTMVSGHADVLYMPSGEARIDVGGYMGWNPPCQYVILYLEDATHFVSELVSAGSVRAWHEAYLDKVMSWDGTTYNPSGACWYCGRAATCPALNRELSTVLRNPDMLDADRATGIIANMKDADCVALWDRIGLVSKFLERARDLIKLRAINSNGEPMTLQGDGRKLVVEEQIRHPLKTTEAMPVLLRHLTEQELSPAVNISKTVAMAAIAAKAPRGMKTKLKEKVEAELDAAHALDEERILFPRLVPSSGASGETLIEGE
jgi:hypothetical protein